MLFKKPWVRNVTMAALLLLLMIMVIGMREVLTPLFIAMVIGYVGDPLIDRLEAWKIPRTWGIVILVVVMTLFLLGFALYVIPKIVHQIEVLGRILPQYWDKFADKFMPNLESAYNDYQDEALEWLRNNGGALFKNLAKSVAGSFASLGALLSSLLGLVIIPVLAFYMLRDWDIMKEKAKELIPLKHRDYLVELFGELDQALGSFIKGQLTVALILSIIYSIGLTIAGCPASLLIGFIAGFANLIPYLGIALGFIPAVLLTYLSGNPMWQVILAGLTFVMGQLLEGMVITPKVVGESVGLHPVVVMVALMIGGRYFGFAGMVLALPASAVLMVLLRRLYLYYVESDLFQEGTNLLPETRGKRQEASGAGGKQ